MSVNLDKEAYRTEGIQQESERIRHRPHFVLLNTLTSDAQGTLEHADEVGSGGTRSGQDARKPHCAEKTRPSRISEREGRSAQRSAAPVRFGPLARSYPGRRKFIRVFERSKCQSSGERVHGPLLSSSADIPLPEVWNLTGELPE